MLRIDIASAGDAASYDVVITPGTVSGGGAATPGALTSPARTLTILPEFHSADANQDHTISLFEITRVLQLFSYTANNTRTTRASRSGPTTDALAAQCSP